MSEKPLRITFSVGKKYRDIVYYLETKENISKFICELIQREMRNDPNEDEFEKKVHSTLLRLLENKEVTLKNIDQSLTFNNEIDSKLTEEEVDIMKGLFD